MISEWKAYFESLLNNPNTSKLPTTIKPADTDLLISVEDFSYDEVAAAISKLKNGKAARADTAKTADALKTVRKEPRRL